VSSIALLRSLCSYIQILRSPEEEKKRKKEKKKKEKEKGVVYLDRLPLRFARWFVGKIALALVSGASGNRPSVFHRRFLHLLLAFRTCAGSICSCLALLFNFAVIV
jgi:hypothetical protein